MTITEFIANIKSADLSKISYNKILSLIRFNSLQLPYTTALVKKGAHIERGRINEDGKLFTSEFDISYRTDLGNIQEFGRANKPVQSRFYGSMPSKEIQWARATILAELIQSYKKIPKSDWKELTFTVGRWHAKEQFEVADVCFSEKYFNNHELKTRYEEWVSTMKGSQMSEKEYQDLLFFFSDEFAKTEIKSHHDYKLSCAYADFAIYSNRLHGVSYPSVQMEYKANNIVLTQEAVEQFLELREVAMFRFVPNSGKPVVIPTHYTTNLGAFNSNFEWKEVKPEDLKVQ